VSEHSLANSHRGRGQKKTTVDDARHLLDSRGREATQYRSDARVDFRDRYVKIPMKGGQEPDGPYLQEDEGGELKIGPKELAS
jgi:hypothetical protein